MKTQTLFPFAAMICLAASGCDKQAPAIEKKIAELERKNNEAADRQRQLELELEDQTLASERDAIERERVRIESDREELERRQGEIAAAEEEALRAREEELANREVKLERIQSSLEEKQEELQERDQQLSEKDRELAGREALAIEVTEQREPVADYGMFYDSLSSYGSWFETPDYGYVWQPVAVSDSNWRPYSRGRWICSDRGWTWVSEEPFGWATYHYGRWALLRGRGWIWVPGTEWAPCWVSWRENENHIGWAPLPPETLAYRGHHWDSTVDVQFGIGAAWFNFVEIRNFGSAIYSHCLPVSGNRGWYGQTVNITYIHIENRQVICGGPKYKRVSERIGRQLPFYRLEVDSHPRQSRDSLGMRPRVKGNKLVVSAPNIDAAWNDSLKPKRIKDRMENISVERDGELSGEIRNRYRQTREEGRQKAERTITDMGGPAKLEQKRGGKQPDDRRPVPGRESTGTNRDAVKTPERPKQDVPVTPLPAGMERPATREATDEKRPDRIVRQPEEDRRRPEVQVDRRNPQVNGGAQVTPPKPRSERQGEEPRVQPREESPRKENAGNRQPDESRREQQRQERARDEQQESARRKQEEQAQQQQRQQEKLREAEQAQKRAMEEERAQRQQQEQARQQQEERARRQQQEEQQREMQRQEERARERQQEEAQERQREQSRQRDREENQRQQENARQRQQQEDHQRQRQQEESRQKQEKEKSDQDEQRKRNR